MNKRITLALIVATLSAVSCKKERTCECTTTSTNSSTDVSGVTTTFPGTPSTTTTTYKKVKKSELRVACKDSKYESNYTATDNGNPDGGGSYKSETTCTLK